jgi:hypothetical protein
MPLTKVKSGGVSDSITLTSPDINAPDIDGGTIDNAVIGGSTAAAGSFTTITATGGSSSNWNTAYGWGDHSTQSYATQTYVGTAVSNLVDSSPAALNTLNELAAALGDDPNFATTVTNSIALKAPLASPSFTGILNVAGGLNSKQAVFTNTNNRGLALSTASRSGQNDGVAIIDAQDTENTGGRLELHTMGVARASFERDQIVFNDGSLDQDFRVESNDNANMLFVDGGANKVGIGVTPSNISSVLTIQSDTGANSLSIIGRNNGSVDESVISFYEYDGTTRNAYIVKESGELAFATGTGGSPTEKFRIASSSVIVNEQSNDVDFRVESQGYSRALHVDADTDDIRMGGTNTQPWGQTSGVGTFQYKIAEHTAQISTDSATGYANLYLNKFNITADDTRLIAFYVNGNQVATITGSTTGVTYNTGSDRRLKKDIETITDGTDKLMAMNPVTHGWKTDPEADTVHGFIAQEMLDIVPEAVSGDPEGEDMMSMDYGRITPIVVAALQDAITKIAELETRLNELEGK